jgi:hypothetical protein
MSIVTVLTTVGLVAIVAMSLARSHGDESSPANQPQATKEPVFACRLGALTPQERAHQKELTARLERATTRVTEDPEGYTFHYAASVPPSAVMAWVENERKCCPFLRFTLDMSEDDGPTRLRDWGVPGTKAFVAAELNVKVS